MVDNSVGPTQNDMNILSSREESHIAVQQPPELIRQTVDLDQTTYRPDNFRIHEREGGSDARIRSAEAEVLGLEGSLGMKLANVGETLETANSNTSAEKGLPSDEPAVAYIERLLAAIDRLRGERDNLRRNVHFLESEAKVVSETNKPDPCGRVENEDQSRDESANIHDTHAAPTGSGSGEEYRKNQTLRRTELAATASAVVIGHIQQQTDAVNHQLSRTLENVQRQLEEKDQHLGTLTGRLEAAEQRAEDAIAQKTDFQHQVARLQCLEEERLREIERLENTHQETQAALIRTTTSLADVTASLEEVESDRDSLNLHVTNLENDLFCAQQAVSDAESRYSALQFQQLSLMSSDEAVQSLKLQVEELEDRVIRRTEQIGMHQHDIKRLETNLRLQEERVGEMTLELETLSAQKEAMVEDCADAREARDEALRKVETLEVEMEGLEARIDAFENERDQEVKSPTNIARDVQDDPSIDTVRQITLALATSQVELRRAVRSLKVADEAQHSLRRQSKVLEEQLELLRVQNAEADSPRGTTLEEELEAIRTRHVEEVTSLQNRLTSAMNELEQVRQLRADTESRHIEVLDETSRLKQELADHLKTAADRSKVDEDSLQTLRAEHATAVGLLQTKLDDLREESREANESRAKFETLHQQVADELARVVLDCESRLTRAAERTREVILHLEDEVARRTDQLVDSGARLDASSAEVARVTRDLQEEVKNRVLDHEGHLKEKASAAERCERAETIQNELRQELDSARRQLEETRVAFEALQEEKGSLQMEMTSLAAEIQRSISLCRFLESQVKENESTITSLKETLESTRADLASSEKSGKAAEINLSLQTAQHERAMSNLSRELAALRSKPALEGSVMRLEEKNAELEELLKSKCTEIEENDDRFIEMLKEKKKLVNKIENLTRKVQNLQGKLASSSPSGPIPTSKSANSVLATTTSSNNVPSPVPVPSRSNSVATHPFPTRSPSNPSTPVSRIPSHSRAVSGPSSLQRSKTPERGPMPPLVRRTKTPEREPLPPLVRRPKTPEREPLPPLSRKTRTPVDATPDSLPSTSFGKKRKVPEDFETCEGVPPKAFTADCLPGDDIENNTPRLRRVLQSVSGFTPVRTRPVASSPKKVVNVASRSITDLTNNPRPSPATSLQPAKPLSKKSWLGKIKGVSQSSRP